MYLKYFKRLIDLLLCTVGFIFFIPLCIIIGLLIKLEDGGPVFYIADRVGKNSIFFKMYKFRSMRVNAPKILNLDGSTYNAKDDSRVTRIGKFIRETSIDEIPQILNVLKGEMSIVGPRASLQGAFGTYLDEEMDKMKVKPGITGYTQAYYRNKLSNREKRLKDAWYANNVSFWLDIKIFFKTIVTIFKREGLYTNVGVKIDRPEEQVRLQMDSRSTLYEKNIIYK